MTSPSEQAVRAACAAIVLLGMSFRGAPAGSPAGPITLDDLPRLPRNVTVCQFSSHNKKGVNGDSNGCLYQDEKGDSVLLDVMGPGCVRSLWQTQIVEGQVLKFTFDGEAEPRYAISCLDLYRGKHPLFHAPLVSLEKVGYYGDNPVAGNCFVPIPFAKSLKISLAGPVGFYHVLCERYPHGTAVTTFTGKEDRRGLLGAFERQGEDPSPPKDTEVIRESAREFTPGQSLALLDVQRAGTVARIVIEGDRRDEFLRQVELAMQWDESPRPDVLSPVGIFFGAAVRAEEVRSLPTKVELLPRERIRLTSYFRMPFWRRARITLANRSPKSAEPFGSIQTEVHLAPARYTEDEAGYFSALYREGRTEMGRDWLFFDAVGTGWFLGAVQTMHGAHYCEGDEHFTVDGAGSPQINGTGSEDYYLACYWPNRNFNLPFAGCVGDVNEKPGPACYYRFHLEAPIPFYGGLDARIEHGGTSDIVSEYRSLGFCYLRRRPALRQTDLVDVANEASERQHGYLAARSKLTEELEASYEGGAVGTLVRDRGRVHAGGEITFTAAIDPDNAGVRLRRRLDQNEPRQAAEVYVNGQPAGTWYHPDHNPHLRWCDSDHDLPAHLTRGKTELKIRLVVLQGQGFGAFTDYRYEVFVAGPSDSSTGQHQPTLTNQGLTMDVHLIDEAVKKLEHMGATVKTQRGRIVDIFLADRALSDGDLAVLDGLYDLRRLSLMDCRYGDRIFDYVKAMPHLEDLSLWGSRVTDDGLRNIATLRLRLLDLRGTQVGDAGLARLRDMRTLETLDLLQTNVTDAGLAHLAHLTNLKELCLVSTRIGDDGLKHLTGLVELAHLELEDTRVTAKGLEHIAKLSKLRVLTLHRTAITDDSLASLSQLRHLNTLYLCDTPITDEGLKHLERLPSLKVLYRNGTKVSAAGVNRLQLALPECVIE